jgi:hypothetical protein
MTKKRSMVRKGVVVDSVYGSLCTCMALSDSADLLRCFNSNISSVASPSPFFGSVNAIWELLGYIKTEIPYLWIQCVHVCECMRVCVCWAEGGGCIMIICVFLYTSWVLLAVLLTLSLMKWLYSQLARPMPTRLFSSSNTTNWSCMKFAPKTAPLPSVRYILGT